ncbi:MAG: Gfo/Idh/MocA family oxidoreductase [Microcoleaceae cyanobacterium]
MMNQLGIGIIGTGFGQKVHIPGLQEYPQTNIVAVYNRDIEKARAIATKYNIANAFDQVDDIVAHPDIVGLTLSTPPFLHFEMAKKVLHAGKHLFLEKPTTLNVDEACQLYYLAKSKGCVVAMDFEFRFVPAWQQLAELLAEGYVGQKYLIKIDWLASSRADPNRSWNWYAQKQMGGGALGAIGSHSFDYINWLFGPVRRMCGVLSTAIAERPDPTEGDRLKPVTADDTCLVTMELADGTPCQMNLSSVAYQGRGHWVEIYGSDGTLVLGSDNQKDYVHGFKLWGSRGGEALREIPISERKAFPKTFSDGRIAPFIRVVDRWVEAIHQETALAPSIKEGVYSQLLMDLTHESDATGTWVDVPDFERFLEAQSW